MAKQPNLTDCIDAVVDCLNVIAAQNTDADKDKVFKAATLMLRDYQRLIDPATNPIVTPIEQMAVSSLLAYSARRVPSSSHSV